MFKFGSPIKKITFLFLILFAVVLSCFAQRDAIQFERISEKEGLSQSTVYSILQDHKGFMWFGTEDGLNRYDGYSFKLFSHKANVEGTISNNRVISIIEDSQKRLWIGTIDGGLNKFDWATETFKSYRHDPNNPNSISKDRVMVLCEDPSGKIWVGTADGGLNLFDPENEQFNIYKNTTDNPNVLPSNVIRSLFVDSNKQLYIGTNNGIAKYNSKSDSFTPIKIIQNNDSVYDLKVVRRFLEDNEGNLWIGTDEEGLVKYDRKDNSFTIYRTNLKKDNWLSSNTVHDLIQDDEGFIWIATFGGLHKFNPKTNKFVVYNHNPNDLNSISSNLLRAIYEDKMGVMWVGSFNYGLNKFVRKHKKFTSYQNKSGEPFGLPSSTIRAIFEDSEGFIWIGTYGEGLVRLNSETEELAYFTHNSESPNSIANNQITSITEDQNKNLWIATNNGLVKYNLKSKVFTNFHHNPKDTNSLPDNRLRTVYVDSNNDLWIGNLSHGISKLESDGKSFTTIRYNPLNPDGGLSQDRVIVFFEDSRGNFWVGTSNEGINLLDRQSGIFKHFKHNIEDTTTVSTNRVLCFHEDSKNRLWIGTGGGGINLFDYDSKTFKSFRLEDGLPNEVIYGILEDDNGVFWLSTNNGLSRFDYSDPNNPQFRNYDKFDGLQSNEFSEGAYAKTQTGLMFFGGINNFNVFNPLEIQDNNIPPLVYITDLVITDKNNVILEDNKRNINLLVSDSLVLNHTENNMSIHFTALHYSVPQKNRYKYKLEGFETSWIEPVDNMRFATYTNLKPGKYTFKVIASNPDGVWNNQGKSFTFTIKAPYWSTWWFYALIILVLAGMIYGLMQMREANLIRSKSDLEAMIVQRTLEISRQNEEILLQTERLQQANEEIRATSETLEEQNRILQAKNDEITFQSTELEEQKNSLANIAWELQDKNEEITAQRNEIEKQKDLLSYQKKEITDSILYAQRIQQAVLPSQEQIRDLFPGFFIFNRPKSIVSGDFYWATRIGKYRIVALVDCTGHGVPGGFMSMLGVLMLNEVISLRRILDPAQALNHLRQSIISVLHQKGESNDATDGMDLSLCIINDEDLTLTYAGANSSIIIWDPKKDINNALIELRSDRMPIAYHLVMKSFNNQTIKLEPESLLFMYSDGIIDQFGGERDKKFQHKGLRDFIQKNKDLPIETQGIVLEQVFDKWKGNSLQIDDVLVLGLKV